MAESPVTLCTPYRFPHTLSLFPIPKIRQHHERSSCNDSGTAVSGDTCVVPWERPWRRSRCSCSRRARRRCRRSDGASGDRTVNGDSSAGWRRAAANRAHMAARLVTKASCPCKRRNSNTLDRVARGPSNFQARCGVSGAGGLKLAWNRCARDSRSTFVGAKRNRRIPRRSKKKAAPPEHIVKGTEMRRIRTLST